MTGTPSGPDFVSFQVRDREASVRFNEETAGPARLSAPSPAANVFSAGDVFSTGEVFSTGGVAFAVRDSFPGVGLEAVDHRGAGIGV